jgi:hypothetical protein
MEGDHLEDPVEDGRGGKYTDRERQQGDLVSLLLLLGYFPKVVLCHLHAVCVSVFQNKERRLKFHPQERGWEAVDWIHLAREGD